MGLTDGASDVPRKNEMAFPGRLGLDDTMEEGPVTGVPVAAAHASDEEVAIVSQDGGRQAVGSLDGFPKSQFVRSASIVQGDP
jgi:hypothetical protein